jgi:hypothetical protein
VRPISIRVHGILAFRIPPEGNGGPDRDQTDDLFVANEALYQLSYRPIKRRVRYWEIEALK